MISSRLFYLFHILISWLFFCRYISVERASAGGCMPGHFNVASELTVQKINLSQIF